MEFYRENMASTTYFEIFVICLILLLPFLYETSHVFRYYFKFAVYYSIVSINSIILIPPMLFRPCDVKNLLLASSFCHHISTVLGLKWELRGKEHLEKDQACIIVANHQSSLDILGMFDIWPVMSKCTVVAKRELFFAWPFGLAAWLCGLIFIDRMQSDRARDHLNKASTNIKNKKIKLWIFAEGTRRNTGELHPFKKGAFHVAINAQIPILPVVFSSYRTFLDDKNKHLNSGHIIISALPPIPTAGLTKFDLDQLIARTYDTMNEEYQAISREVIEELELSERSTRKSSFVTRALNMAATFTGNMQNDSRHCIIDDDKSNNFIIQNHRTQPPTAN
ncbi:1-acyl-sn-glycerol-3-phosphate acyltransferase alpha [Contarinia nasturtii]|uniref:1-acyl-sn-glycerol-3-phosphate acyltransferase alpha n=1 Tax=Contarinia nasturtii TaxID=265458 RepID=UPI0012D49F55|nr:1-acyl-sn-glycerol-3-phosphate acyltransferase alpha [Contarinia nasturtii]